MKYADIDNNMKNEIESWGIPDIEELRNRDIKFVFDLNEINEEETRYNMLFCKNDNVKFCLYDFTNNIKIFTMDFFKMSERFLKINNELPSLKLELLNVNNPSLRQKGIASYYLERLKEYAIKHKYSCIRVTPSPDANVFKDQSKENALNLKKLTEFYKRKSTPEMPIEILEF
ncbi:hypothetical protein GNF85_06890 [Clostridium perfringens]